MNLWPSFKPLLWIALLLSAVLLALSGLLSAGWDRHIVPTPETTAAELTGALGARRYAGVRNHLSHELRQQVTDHDLRRLAEQIESGPAQGIRQAHGVHSEIHGDRATAQVRVRLGTRAEITLHFPLVKEHGLWKVASLDPLTALAGE
jgi:hypothetical protein